MVPRLFKLDADDAKEPSRENPASTASLADGFARADGPKGGGANRKNRVSLDERARGAFRV